MSNSKEFAVVSDNETTLLERVQAAQEQLERVEITNDDDFAKGGTMIKALRQLGKDIEAERKELVGPLNDEVKLINARFKANLAVVEGATKAVQPKLDSYLAEKEKEREAAIAAERAEREAKALETADKMEQQGATEAAELALVQGTQKTAAEKKKLGVTSEYGVTTSATVTWTGEEYDKAAILKAALDGRFPLEAISISKAAINAYAREQQSEGVVDGIKITRNLKAVAR